MTASPESEESAEDARIGTLLGGRYRLLSCLGRGGMGAVYRAEHVELGRSVAVKVLASELARNHSAIERFLREARTASRINHPNIVHVYDLGRANDGSPYLAMELLEGRDLADELDAQGGVLEAARVIEVLGPVADALDVCHAKGVVHRDLKPSNIVLARLDDGRVIPKLVDFGLAMLFASDERLTRTGTIAGTPHYMPPEAARGELAGPAGDVYALATLAYRALSGVTPFDATVPNGVLVQKLTEDAPPMRERAPGFYPDGVEAALAHGLARDPEARPPSAGAFVRELAAAIEEARTEHWGPLGDTPSRQSSPTSAQIPALRARPPDGLAVAAVAQRAAEERSRVRPVPEARDRRLAPRIAAAVILVVGLLAAVLFGEWQRRSPPAPARETPTSPQPPRLAPERAEIAEPIEPPATRVQDSADQPEEEPPAPTEPRAAEPARAPAPERRQASLEREPRTAPPEPSPAVVPTTPAPAAQEDAPAAPGDDAEAQRLVRSAASLLLRGDHQGATSLLERATRIAPRHAPAWRSLGLAHERAQRPSDARRAYQRYLELAPDAADAAQIRQRVSSL